ncbi:Uncharacterised protein [Vibrio cholerae]|nr:Uncharacterised protein [Vibrio cholerae]CSI82716.1 Uncharacterised protein [Vibrio cholerae]
MCISNQPNKEVSMIELLTAFVQLLTAIINAFFL